MTDDAPPPNGHGMRAGARRAAPVGPAASGDHDGSALVLPDAAARTRSSARADKVARRVSFRLHSMFFVTVTALSLAGWTTFGPGLLEGEASPAAAGSDSPAPEAGANHQMKVNQLGVLASPDGDPQVQVTLTAIDKDFTCPETGAPAARNGHYLALTLLVQTTTNYGEGAGDEPQPFPVALDKFSVLSAERVMDPGTFTDQVACLGDAGQPLTAMGSDGAQVLQVVLDTAQTSGSVMFAPGAWEWAF